MSKLAYLDYNIFPSVEEGLITLSDFRKIDHEISAFPFSAAHI